MQDEPESKSHAANILSNNLFLSNCTFLAISLSVYLLAVLSNLSKVTLSFRYIRALGILLNFSLCTSLLNLFLSYISINNQIFLVSLLSTDTPPSGISF